MVVLLLSLALTLMSYSQAHNNLELLKKENPFPYNLGIKIIPSKNNSPEVTICCHGYGHNNQIVNYVMLPGTLIGFNFPDYNITPTRDHKKASYGTINEILPLLYILKRCVADLKLPTINLYGFSAGGGAVVNALAVLNHFTYKKELEQIGITEHKKQQIISALEKGIIILDCPLKSCDEVAQWIKSPEFETLASNYSITQNFIGILKMKQYIHLQSR